MCVCVSVSVCLSVCVANPVAVELRCHATALICSGRIRTLVVMATYSFHRLLMGKAKIDNFSSQWGCLEFIFTEIFIDTCTTVFIC